MLIDGGKNNQDFTCDTNWGTFEDKISDAATEHGIVFGILTAWAQLNKKSYFNLCLKL